MVRSWFLAGALISTFFAPAVRCAAAFSVRPYPSIQPPSSESERTVDGGTQPDRIGQPEMREEKKRNGQCAQTGTHRIDQIKPAGSKPQPVLTAIHQLTEQRQRAAHTKRRN